MSAAPSEPAAERRVAANADESPESQASVPAEPQALEERPPAAGAEEAASSADPAASPRTPGGVVTLQQLRDAWPEILEIVQGIKRGSWMVVYTSTPRAYDGANEVLTLTFPSDNDVQGFRQAQGAGESVSEHLRQAIQRVLGVRVKFIARVEGGAAAPAPSAASDAAAAPEAKPAAGGWNVTPIPNSAPAAAVDDAPTGATPAAEPPADEVPPPDEADAPPPDDEPEPAPDIAPAPAAAAERAVRPREDSPAGASAEAPRSNPNRPGRYGEAVVREVLKASFIEEEQLNPRDRPVRLVEEPAPVVADAPEAGA